MNRDYQIDNRKSSDEVQDIIDRMPVKTGRLVAVILVFLSGSLLFLAWLIEYPEKVTGPVSITAQRAPVRLVANSSGKLRLLKQSFDTVKENEIVAYIENSARLDDILKIEDFIINNHPDSLFHNPYFSSNNASLSLGELSLPCYNLINNLEKVLQYIEGKPYEKKIENLLLLLNSQLKLEEYYKEQLSTNEKRLLIAGKKIKRDSMLFRSSAIAEQDIDQSSLNFLGILENSKEAEEEYTNLKMQIDNTRHSLQMLILEKAETEQQLRIDLISSFNQLSAGIYSWKMKYTFSSPFDGSLEYLNFWRENDFINAGTSVFSILPSDNPMLGQVYLPSRGAGKVAVGQEVIIRLDNYPYIEYGSIAGKVRSISNIANLTTESVSQGLVNTYLILIDLPDQLTTNYGVKLDFSYEIKGMADILTRKRKLILRLFDNIRYIASKK